MLGWGLKRMGEAARHPVESRRSAVKLCARLVPGEKTAYGRPGIAWPGMPRHGMIVCYHRSSLLGERSHVMGVEGGRELHESGSLSVQSFWPHGANVFGKHGSLCHDHHSFLSAFCAFCRLCISRLTTSSIMIRE